MNSFGYKIVDRNVAEIAPIVRSAIAQQCPLEIGLYFEDGPTWDFLLAAAQGSRLSLHTHLDHRRLNVLDCDRHRSLLDQQLERSLGLGARYAVTHVGAYPMSPRLAHREALFQVLLANLRRLDDVCRDLDFSLHLENVFHGLGFYRLLFHKIRRAALERIHFCFDLGHAKVWSLEPLSDWLDFLEALQKDAFRLHFHLHTNAGLADDHLSFVRAEKLGLTEPDRYTGGSNYFEALEEIDRRFPESPRVFEVPAEEALVNREWVCSRIAQVRDGPHATALPLR